MLLIFCIKERRISPGTILFWISSKRIPDWTSPCSIRIPAFWRLCITPRVTALSAPVLRMWWSVMSWIPVKIIFISTLWSMERLIFPIIYLCAIRTAASSECFLWADPVKQSPYPFRITSIRWRGWSSVLWLSYLSASIFTPEDSWLYYSIFTASCRR